MEKPYRIRIVRGDAELEVEGDREFVLEMLQKYGPGKGTSQATSGDDSETGATEPSKARSAREFIQALGLKKHTDIVLAFGYYLEHQQGKEVFSPADINNCYYEAKLEPSNTSQAIIQNIKRGVLMTKGPATKKKAARKRYTLTQSGEEYIERRLHG